MKTVETDTLDILAKSYAARAMQAYGEIEPSKASYAAREIARLAVEMALKEHSKIGGNHGALSNTLEDVTQKITRGEW